MKIAQLLFDYLPNKQIFYALAFIFIQFELDGIDMLLILGIHNFYSQTFGLYFQKSDYISFQIE